MDRKFKKEIGEDFFKKYENLTKIDFDACKEGRVKTDPMEQSPGPFIEKRLVH